MPGVDLGRTKNQPAPMSFHQSPPELGNQFDDDRLIREYLERTLPQEALKAEQENYRQLGELSGGELYRAMLEDRLNEPQLTQWDPWGNRIDHIELTGLWKKAQTIASEYGLVAAGYEDRYGVHDRVHQFALNYLVQASLDVYSCPLAMTDGAARTLLDTGNQALIDRAVGRLTSRSPSQMWTSGQWMTERTGGSDVGLSETIAQPTQTKGVYALSGTKWFTSATTSQMALTLARPEGNGKGGRGLALFYIEMKNSDGSPNNIWVNRLKDKLGTRKVPTAELTLDGALGTAVKGTENGTRNISTMLNITRTWNSVSAAYFTRRCMALALSYAQKRFAFGNTLDKKPLHVDTLAALQAQNEAVFHLAFRTVELLGKVEKKEASEAEQLLLRILTPVAKLTTAKQAVRLASETVESFGGAGYIEDTHLPMLLRDAQVLPIWEGTTNVLSLDTLKTLSTPGMGAALLEEVERCCASVSHPDLRGCVEKVRATTDIAAEWLRWASEHPLQAEGGARRFALTIGHTLQLALMVHHAQWTIDQQKGPQAALAARHFCLQGIDLIDQQLDSFDSSLLLQS